MRTFLKKIIGSNGYWACERCIQKGESVKAPGLKKKTVQMREVDAPLRRDDEFLTYCVSDHSMDNHLPNPLDESPFIEIGFPMVTGFIIDAMHTVFAGAFNQRLKGIAQLRHEGRVNIVKRNKIESNIRLFKKSKPYEFDRFVRSLVNCGSKYKFHELRQFLYYLLFPVFDGVLRENDLINLLRLQHSMLLLGGCSPSPVSTSNISKASLELKTYVKELVSESIPIRITTHEMIHIPEDVQKYQCGVERIAAWRFMSFQRIFKRILKSGNKIAEQISNRLIERSTYLLPTTADGMILATSQEFKKELMRTEALRTQQNIFVEFFSKGDKWPKKLRFTTFTLSNRFPNNVCMLKKGAVFVVTDIVEFPKGSGCLYIVGQKFGKITDAFLNPFPSSDFHIYVASKLTSSIFEYRISSIKCKMYALPYKWDKKQGEASITNANQKWFVAPLQHTFK